MAKIEKVVTVRVKDDQFGFEALLSFQTENYVGEWNGYENKYILFDKTESEHAGGIEGYIYADNLEELINKVKELLDEEIIEVYDRYITEMTFNL